MNRPPPGDTNTINVGFPDLNFVLPKAATPKKSSAFFHLTSGLDVLYHLLLLASFLPHLIAHPQTGSSATALCPCGCIVVTITPGWSCLFKAVPTPRSERSHAMAHTGCSTQVSLTPVPFWKQYWRCHFKMPRACKQCSVQGCQQQSSHDHRLRPCTKSSKDSWGGLFSLSESFKHFCQKYVAEILFHNCQKLNFP